MRGNAQLKIKVLGILIVFGAIILLGKLYLVQVVQAQFFKDQADRQHVRPGESVFSRGTISFKEKSGNLVDAATLKSGYTVSMNPRLLTDKEDAYEKINAIYGLPRDYFMEKASKDDIYEALIQKATEKEGKKIEALKIPGIYIELERNRFYPGNALASQVLGFVGYRGDSRVGQYGLERYYDDVLSRSEASVYANFFSQIFSGIGNGTAAKDFGGEGDLILTIEPTVETFITEELRKIMETYKSEQSGAIVMNPKTGEIYAMAAVPDFDPNEYQKERNPQVFVNPLVENVFEMGSIVKPLTIAAGLDAGAITRETTYEDTGCTTIDTKTFCNHDLKAHGVVSMQEVLSQSLNLGAAHVVSKLGNEQFATYMKKYGFGEETGIDLPNEVRGLIRNLDSKRNIEYATASYGQGIALSPVATVRALASLGNGGKLVTPHVVREIHYQSGITKKIAYGEGKQILKPETSMEISRMLVHVVDTKLANGKAKNPKYSVAAKTGTAQIANPAGGGYYQDRYLHSFFGYFPAYDPEFIVFYYTIHPQGVQFASETLAQPFLETSRFLINYYNIPPDR